MKYKGLGLDKDDKSLLRLQSHIYADFFNRIRNLCITRYKWNNLPEGMNGRYIEWILFYNGKCALYYDDILERYLSLECTTSGEMGFYNLPKTVTCYSTNVDYTLREMPTSECALVFNNYSWLPDAPTADLFAYKLTEIDMGILSNVELQKFPVIVKSPEKKRLSYLNLMKKFFGFQPFILSDEKLMTEGIEVLNLNMPFIADKLQIQKVNTWKEMLNTFGIAATTSEKTERLVSNEVAAGLGFSEISQHIGLEPRRDAAEAFNKLYGTNISVEFNSELYTELFYPRQGGLTDDMVGDLLNE